MYQTRWGRQFSDSKSASSPSDKPCETLRYRKEGSKNFIDTLVLSIDEKSEIITYDESEMNHSYSGGQNKLKMPEKLFYKREKLYLLGTNGKVISEKIKGFMTKRKYVSYYILINRTFG